MKNFVRLIFLMLDFPLAWAAVFGVVLVDYIWISKTLFNIPSPWSALINFLFFINVKLLCNSLVSVYGITSQRTVSFLKSCLLGFEVVLLLRGGAYAFCILAYLFCGLDHPLIDQQLAKLDQAFGFDWYKALQWSQTQPIYIVLKIAYASLIPQLVLIVGCSIFHRNKERLHEMFWILFFSLLITVVVSGFMPALGPAQTFGLESYLAHIQTEFKAISSQVLAIRSEKSFSTTSILGIIAFPSFHAISSIVYIYSSRRFGIWSWVIFLLNCNMLISTLIFGNHYLVDLIAGAVVAIINILLVRMFIHNQNYSDSKSVPPSLGLRS